MAQLRKQLRKAARRADGSITITKLSDFNPVVPKGMQLVSVSVVSEHTIVTNFAPKPKQT